MVDFKDLFSMVVELSITFILVDVKMFQVFLVEVDDVNREW
jgi:hypothetical protein